MPVTSKHRTAPHPGHLLPEPHHHLPRQDMSTNPSFEPVLTVKVSFVTHASCDRKLMIPLAHAGQPFENWHVSNNTTSLQTNQLNRPGSEWAVHNLRCKYTCIPQIEGLTKSYTQPFTGGNLKSVNGGLLSGLVDAECIHGLDLSRLDASQDFTRLAVESVWR
jgi:hypothetical protein